MTSIYEKKILAEVQLVHAEQNHFKEKKKPEHMCLPVEFVKLSRTVVVASENT